MTLEWLYRGTSIISLPLVIYITFQVGKVVQNIQDLNKRVSQLEKKVYCKGDK